jgi:2-phosphosulfolactate phosphatase
MPIKVALAFVPREARGPCDAALVIDVLRATSVMVTLAAGGAPRVLLARGIRHAVQLKRALGEGWYTSGARKGRKVKVFDYANAMQEFAAMDLAGRNFVLSTTNGTAVAYRAKRLSRRTFVGALLNATATAHALVAAAGPGGSCLVVLAGVRGTYSVDDALAAGVVLARLEELAPDAVLDDRARTCLLMARGADGAMGREIAGSYTGRLLAESGLGGEVDFVLDVDRYDLAVEVVEDGPPGTLGLRSVPWKPRS